MEAIEDFYSFKNFSLQRKKGVRIRSPVFITGREVANPL